MRRLFTHIALVATMMLSVSSFAEDLTADVVKISTPLYQAEVADFKPRFGSYTFTISWQGIPAATVGVDFEEEGLYYRAVATAETYSGIDLFYRLRYRAEGVVSAVDLSPVKSVFDQQENSRERLTEVTYLNNGEVRSFRKSKGKDAVVMQFDPHNYMLEPFSAAFLARSLSWEVGQSRQFDTFNGKSRYLITLTSVGETTLKVNGENRKVWIISPTVKNLTSAAQSKKLREARIFVTADGYHEIVRLESEVFIGTVTASLDSFIPADSTIPHATHVAQNAPPTLLK